MKKIKVFLTLILFSLACMFTLVACGGKPGYYVDGSFDVDVSSYSSGSVYADVGFNVALPDAATYEVSYTLELYYMGEYIESERFTTTCKSSGNDIADISKFWMVDSDISNAYAGFFEVQVSNIVAKTKFSSLSEYSGLSIGFGILGGLMTVCLVVLYVYLKKKDRNGQIA